MKFIIICLLFLSSCTSYDYTVRVKKVINNDFILGKSLGERGILYGNDPENLWTYGKSDTLGNGEHNTARSLIMKNPIEMAISEKYLIFKNDKKHLIIQYNENGNRKFHFSNSKKKYHKKRKKIGVPETLTLSPIVY